MIIWTVLPEEIVLNDTLAQELPKLEEVDYGGTKLIVETMSPSQCRIVRILSSDPQDYLRPELQPGVVLTYRPVYEFQ
jgi:hypothetical protein